MNDEGKPEILIEAKSQNVRIRKNSPPTPQLIRYALVYESVFHVALTNGVDWNWYKKKSGSARLEDSPFMVHSAIEPTERETEWLVSLKLDPGRLGEIAFEEQIRSRLHHWFLNEISSEGPTKKLLTLIGSEVREGNSVTRRETELIQNLWPKVVHDHIDNEIRQRIDRLKKHNADSDEISDNSMPISDENNIYTPEKPSNQFQTESGKKELISDSRESMWKKRGGQHQKTNNMTQLCLQVIREIARMDDRDENEFYQTASQGLHCIRESKTILSKHERWQKLNQSWSFNVAANTESKLKRVRRVAKYCRVDHLPIELEKEFEIWGPKGKLI